MRAFDISMKDEEKIKKKLENLTIYRFHLEGDIMLKCSLYANDNEELYLRHCRIVDMPI